MAFGTVGCMYDYPLTTYGPNQLSFRVWRRKRWGTMRRKNVILCEDLDPIRI
jgi:hypothetical protein